ncbi:heme-degrading domain-containing protein [Telmatospirillum sp.]|uniref:heme-degrading domain-containing protein n=1 Tax=Telmatospirillum sp. TaxID=2079197 RepID=UPI00283D3C38|nr:heme-degrading domain-containing protein [Telmatospirillum sp.]MDR3435339.1 heme-degrading domain-containing protein [Telmatospirillum sp.]
MSVEDDLYRIAQQEQRLQFDRFNPDVAWDIGCRLRETAQAHDAAVAIDVSLPGQQLFYFAMPGTSPNNADWVRRKRNTVLRFFRSSYATGLLMSQRQTTLAAAYGLDFRDYADHGGSFPLQVAGQGCIGAVTVSGLPQRDDHSLVAEALAGLLGHDIADIALAPEE